MSRSLRILVGLVYLLTYFAAILLVLPLLIAAGIAAVAERVLSKS